MSTQHVFSGTSGPAAIRLMKVPDLWPPADGDRTPGMYPGADPDAQPGGYRPRGQDAADRADPADGGRGWPQQFAVALAETLAGVRPVRQIQPWLSKRGSIHLHRVRPLFAGGHRPRVQRVLTARPSPGVIEMTMIVTVGPRTRALAMRLEQAGPAPGDLPPDKAVARPGVARPPLPARQDRATHAVRWICTDIETA